MSDVIYRATKYMNVEDALLAREEKPKKRERQEDPRRTKGERCLEPKIGERTKTPSPLQGRS